ncbi:hypothetical protein B0H67DRAFT_250997 [Lasiosphaeris hirsuta]|uniref:RING-type domain-containing protein n=1 Tax=Lasiosphaeris hirsuta TaxID=260670 RepID=A0AA40DWN0_9PEZI|nr:hypothetical protein B0H67DRAFT_250997 [Lasiosphaeris hirsuta]
MVEQSGVVHAQQLCQLPLQCLNLFVGFVRKQGYGACNLFVPTLNKHLLIGYLLLTINSFGIIPLNHLQNTAQVTLQDLVAYSRTHQIQSMAQPQAPAPNWDDCFVPDPRYTFLYAKKQIGCVICKEHVLRLRPEMETLDECRDSIPALLPCGHVFGRACLEEWLSQGNLSCPACRIALVYPICRHAIRPRNLYEDTIFTVPKTIPRGGVIDISCEICLEGTNHHVARQLWDSLTQVLTQAEYRLSRCNPNDGVETVEACKRHVDDTRKLMDQVVERTMSPQTYQW